VTEDAVEQAASVETNYVMLDMKKSVGQKISLKHLPRILNCTLIFLALIRTVKI
jgi:hypothetical protein